MRKAVGSVGCDDEHDLAWSQVVGIPDFLRHRFLFAPRTFIFGVVLVAIGVQTAD